MDGSKLIAALRKRASTDKFSSTITDSALAKYLGVTQPALKNYRKNPITERQIVNLLEAYSKIRIDQLMENSIIAIVEFLSIDRAKTQRGAKWEIFSDVNEHNMAHSYLAGLKAKLEGVRGIYVFHDSRGRAIYVGKTTKQSLWKEINLAFNRNRGDVQSIKTVHHPNSNVKYRGPEEVSRKIVRHAVALHEIAAYVSAYQIPVGLIGKFEAFLVRSFANDLLNVKMENF